MLIQRLSIYGGTVNQKGEGGQADIIHFFTLNTVPTRLVDASTILGFAFLGAATIRITILQIHLTKKL